MVVGLDKFREFFAEFHDSYTIIGGAACDILFESAGLSFRPTKDIDLVLSVEVVGLAFGQRFREFLDAGGYRAREQSTGHREFYRFHRLRDDSFPFMIEIFSREPNEIELPVDIGVRRLEVEAGLVSLSALLLNPAYFEAMQRGKKLVDGVAILDESLLIPFKAKAFVDLSTRRARGETVRRVDMKKHRNDVFRLSQLLADMPVDVGETLQEDMRVFLELVEKDSSFDPQTFDVPVTREEGILFLRRVYRLS